MGVPTTEERFIQWANEKWTWNPSNAKWERYFEGCLYQASFRELFSRYVKQFPYVEPTISEDIARTLVQSKYRNHNDMDPKPNIALLIIVGMIVVLAASFAIFHLLKL